MTRRPSMSAAPGRWLVLAALVGGYAALHRLGRTYGASVDERGTRLPGDGIVPKPQLVVTHATSIDATPDQVWPWLIQMGWHRGGWYTARWVDRLLFPGNWPSADRILDDLQDLQVGDFIPDGAPETQCGFLVEELERDRCLVLHSTSHLPLGWREKGIAAVNWTWAFVLRSEEEGRTRLIFRWCARTRPWWLTAGAWAVIVPADYLMSRDMLQGIKRRVETTPPQGPPASGTIAPGAVAYRG